MHFAKRKKPIALMLALALAASALLAGCGGQKQQAAGGAAQVKAMKVLQQDTPVVSEYAGQIAGKDEVKVQPKVSGRVVEEYVHGGDAVQAGQPLYRIDSRQYESAVLQAQATLAQSQATLANAQTDLGRDQELLASDAISEQQVTTQQANVNAYSAAAAANQALLQKAQQDLSDTVVYAPMSGQVSVDDVAIGTVATAGNTNLVTIGTTDPVFVTFSISETEYLKFRNIQQMQSGSGNGITVAIKLSDGTTYPLDERIVQAVRALTQNPGTLAVEALFGKPDGLLLPGMFARVKLTGETVPNAILVPQRAVQQLLDKTFVMVVGADGKSEARKIELGQQVGSYYIVKSGLSAEDTVIVEGLSSLTEGKDLTVTMVTPADMGFSLDEDTTPYDTMTSSDASSGSES